MQQFHHMVCIFFIITNFTILSIQFFRCLLFFYTIFMFFYNFYRFFLPPNSSDKSNDKTYKNNMIAKLHYMIVKRIIRSQSFTSCMETGGYILFQPYGFIRSPPQPYPETGHSSPPILLLMWSTTNSVQETGRIYH